MKHLVSSEVLRSEFVKELERISGQNLAACYQCGKCSAGCPIAFEMDYLPNQIIRMASLGMEHPVLSSHTIWLCVGCETCITRCPREVELAQIMDGLRIIARRKEVKPAEKDIALFNKLFLDVMGKYGRVYEAEMIAKFNLGSGHLFKDVLMGPKLIRKGKLNLFPAKADATKMRRIFKTILPKKPLKDKVTNFLKRISELKR